MPDPANPIPIASTMNTPRNTSLAAARTYGGLSPARATAAFSGRSGTYATIT